MNPFKKIKNLFVDNQTEDEPNRRLFGETRVVDQKSGEQTETVFPSLVGSALGKKITFKKTMSNNQPLFQDNSAENEELRRQAPLHTATVIQSTQGNKPSAGQWKGTNYDPLDPSQNRPNAKPETIGIGAAGVRMDEGMVAVPRKDDGITAMLRLGTVIYIPELNRKFLVADLQNARFNGQQKLDFVTSGTGSGISPAHNKNFNNIVIVREGQGRADVREYVESGQWEEDKNK